MIDILVPVLDRPHNVERLLKSLKRSTNETHRVLFLCTEGDEAEIAAVQASGHPFHVGRYAGGHEYPRKMNAGFLMTENPFLLMGADDIVFMKNWDRYAIRVAQKTGAGVIGTDDMFNAGVTAGDFATHALIRRSYIDQQGGSLDGPGKIFHEGYHHNYVDVELSRLAMVRGQWAFAKRSKIKHVYGGNQSDETYRLGFRHFRRDHQLYVRRARSYDPDYMRRGRRRRR